jgi:MraZ protein
MILSGSHPQTIDDRGRLAVPARLLPALRALAGVGEEDELEVVISMTFEGRLGIYPVPYFNRMMANLEKAPEEDVDAQELRRAFLNYSDQQTLDKQNRVRVPAALAEYFELRGEVTVMGSGEYLEVVTREAWMRDLTERREKFKANRGRLGAVLAGKSPAPPMA